MCAVCAQVCLCIYISLYYYKIWFKLPCQHQMFSKFSISSGFCRFGEHSGDSLCAACQSQQLLQPLDIHDLQRSPPTGFCALPALPRENEH